MKIFLANQSGTPFNPEPGYHLKTEKTAPEGGIAPLPAFFSKAPS
jgi:hypothetical protein